MAFHHSIIFWACSFHFILCCTGAENIQENPKLHLREGYGLKDVYDAGLRPRRLSDSLFAHCRTGPMRVELKIADGGEVVLDTQGVGFDVAADYSITSVELATDFVPIPKAVSIMHAFCDGVAMDTAGLDEAARTVGNVPNAHQRWYGSQRIGKIDVGAEFSPLFQPDGTTQAQCLFSITWRFPPGAMRSWSEPIKPPPGYESESMEPLPFRPSGQARPAEYVPAFKDRTADEQAEMVRRLKEAGLSLDPAPPGPAKASEAGPESGKGGSGSLPPVGSQPSGNVPWWLPWLVILVVAALWWAMRGGKASSG